jgi:hypothetical protein
MRYLLHQPERAPLLSEEVLVAAYTDGDAPGAHQWLADAKALRLLAEAKPDANVSMHEKRALIADALDAWPTLESILRERIKTRAAELEASHKRVCQAVSLRVRELAVTPPAPAGLARASHPATGGVIMATLPAIRIEGGLLGPDVLDQLLAAALPGQKPADFGLDGRRNLTDEVAAIFADARALWQVFQHRLQRLSAEDLATSVTRDAWGIPFLGLLGVRAALQHARL